jgi:hypothetical protein
MEEEGILGATFFIDQRQAQTRDPCRIVQTLAYDLAKYNHKQLEALWNVLRENPTFERLSYEEQARLLLKHPLDKALNGTLVIVIDGLDECGATNGALLLATLVKLLAHHPIKLFVTSRDEDEIVDRLRDVPHTSYKLQESEVSGDMQLYWEHNLDELCRRKRLPDWRPLFKIEQLVDLTGHLFIYATTIFKIISATKTSPFKKLRGLLEISRSKSGSAAAFVGPDTYGPLEKLYIHILGEAVKDNDGNMIAEYAAHLQDILEVVIDAQAPITPQALSDLLHIKISDLKSYLAPLHSLLFFPDATSADRMVQPLHQSFPDFFRQQGSIVHSELSMDVDLGHRNTVEHCFFQLNRLLPSDNYDIKDAPLCNQEASDLPTRLNECVSVAGIQESIDVIMKRLEQQQDSECASLRTSELISTPICGCLALTHVKRSLTD